MICVTISLCIHVCFCDLYFVYYLATSPSHCPPPFIFILLSFLYPTVLPKPTSFPSLPLPSPLPSPDAQRKWRTCVKSAWIFRRTFPASASWRRRSWIWTDKSRISRRQSRSWGTRRGPSRWERPTMLLVQWILNSSELFLTLKLLTHFMIGISVAGSNYGLFYRTS